MIVMAIKFGKRTFELRKGPVNYVGFLPGEHIVIPSNEDSDAAKMFVEMFLKRITAATPRIHLGQHAETAAWRRAHPEEMYGMLD
jgi:hypothetical protein